MKVENMNEQLEMNLIRELLKVMNREQALRIFTPIVLEKKEQQMINFLKQKVRTVEEVSKQIINLIK